MTRHKRFFEIIGTLAAIRVMVFLLQRTVVPVIGQAPTGTGKAAEIKTLWVEADFQGSWSVDVLLQRPPLPIENHLIGE